MNNMKKLVYLYCMSIVSLLIYLRAYFPIQKSELFHLKPPDAIKDYAFDKSKFLRPSIDRLVFIVIDALREDFITNENMPYTYKASGCKFKVKTEAPTVTLPRIKALTTGSVPQFIDLILNFGSGGRCNESFLHRAVKAMKKIVFYGDDTWIKIFPDLFLRKEGTSSFYVNDFYEVDTNVTRNVLNEVQKSDWDIMFLHYLGLDHIGHVKGPYSHLVKPKLLEMDEIIEKIHVTLGNDLGTLIVVTGDHGMKNSGGHGGTTYEETHVPLITFGISCDNKPYITQVDIPATLAVLFGIQIPTSSIGNLIPEFLKTYDYKRRLYFMYYNSEVLKRKSRVCDDQLDKAGELFYVLLKNYSEVEAVKIYNMYEECSLKIRDDLIYKSLQQDVMPLIFALINSITTFLFIIDFTYDSKHFILPYVQTVVILLFIFNSIDSIFLFLTFVSLIILFLNIYKLLRRFKANKCNMKDFITTAAVVHGLLLNSSSFIEEEHQIWYFYTMTYVTNMVYFNLKRGFKSSIILLVVMRFVRTLNSTGDQWASVIDLGDILKSEQNFFYLQFFYATSLLLTFITLVNVSKAKKYQCMQYLFVLIMIYLFKMYYLHKVIFAQIIWLSIILSIVLSKYLKLSRLILITWILVITLLMQPHNVILIPAGLFLLFTLQSHVENLKLLSYAHYWIGWALFFCQGHCNSFASIDLAPGYIGLDTYVPFLTFSFVIIHTYAFPILSLIIILYNNHQNSNDIFVVNILNRLFTLIIILFVTCLHRNHLFVWSVFAPKLLIEASHTAVLFIVINLYNLIQFMYSLKFFTQNKV